MRGASPDRGFNSGGGFEMVGRFTGNGATGITAKFGKGFTTARTGTGTYTVTLADPPLGNLVYIDVTLVGPVADLFIQITGYNTTTNVLSLSAASISARAATDLSTSYDVCFRLKFASPVQT